MIVLTIVFLLSIKVFAEQIYTMQDLKILASQKEYIEYLNHAKDITPSNRNKQWKTLTLKIGIDYATSLSKQKIGTVTTKDKELIKNLSKWPLFRADESFRISKRPLITLALKQCLSSNKNVESCINTTKQLYIKDRDPELGINLIKVLNNERPMSFNPKKITEFLTPMLASNICVYYIDKSPLKEVLDVLTATTNEIYKDNKIDKDCRKKIAKKLFKRLYSTDNNSVRRDDKILLRKWGLLHSNDIYFYNIAQFLSDYQFPKNLILTKWKTFRTLGKNQKLREIILNKLLKRRPLYGKILYNRTNESKAVISAIKRYLPEYFVDFSKLCLKYFKGKITAPSADCHQLFKRSKTLELFSNVKYNEYEKIMSSWKNEIK